MLVLLFGEFEASSHQNGEDFDASCDWMNPGIAAVSLSGVIFWHRKLLSKVKNPDRHFQHFLNILGREIVRDASQFYCRYFQRFVQPVGHAGLICWKRVYTKTIQVHIQLKRTSLTISESSLCILWLLYDWYSEVVPLPALSEPFCKQLVVGPRSGRRHVPFDEPKSARLKGGGRWSVGPVDVTSLQLHNLFCLWW